MFKYLKTCFYFLMVNLNKTVHTFDLIGAIFSHLYEDSNWSFLLFPLGLFVFISVFPVERRLFPHIIFIFTLFCQVDIIIIFILWLTCLRKHIVVLFFLQWMSEKVITNQPNPRSSFLIKLYSLFSPKVSSYPPIPYLLQPPETVVLLY